MSQGFDETLSQGDEDFTIPQKFPYAQNSVKSKAPNDDSETLTMYFMMAKKNPK